MTRSRPLTRSLCDLYSIGADAAGSAPHVPPVAIVAQSGTYYTSNTFNLELSGDFDKVYLYDQDGNCTNVSIAGTNISYTWDAKNRLATVNTYVTNTATLYTTEFTYDGLDRCCQMVEEENGSPTSTKRFVWCGSQRCQERDGNNAVTKGFFAEGEQIDGANYYCQKDHLGTIWSTTDSSGGIDSLYTYDPYGQQTTLVGGAVDSDFGYAGMYFHGPSGLNLTLYRAYDSSSGRWISRDPIEENGGLNLYGYVGNNPINEIDPSGLNPAEEMATAIASDDPEQIQLVLDAWDNEMPANLRQQGLNAIKKLRTPCRDLVRGSLKRSPSYHSELENKTYQEIAKDSSKEAKQMRKLIDQSERLMQKINK